MPTENGYSNQKKLGQAQFKTIHNLGYNTFGPRTNTTTAYLKTAASALVAVTPILGVDGQIRFLQLEITAHNAWIGDLVKMTDGTLDSWEFEIVQIIDVDNVYVLPTAPSYPLVGELAEIVGHTTLRTGKDGGISVDPTGLATAGNQVLEIAELAIIKANQDYSPLGIILLDFVATNVDNTAYVEISADIGASKARKVQIFMSSGDPLYLAYGAAASEVDELAIIPGGNGLIDLVIPANTRLSVKAIDVVTVSSGRLIINLLG